MISLPPPCSLIEYTGTGVMLRIFGYDFVRGLVFKCRLGVSRLKRYLPPERLDAFQAQLDNGEINEVRAKGRTQWTDLKEGGEKVMNRAQPFIEFLQSRLPGCATRDGMRAVVQEALTKGLGDSDFYLYRKLDLFFDGGMVLAAVAGKYKGPGKRTNTNGKRPGPKNKFKDRQSEFYFSDEWKELLKKEVEAFRAAKVPFTTKDVCDKFTDRYFSRLDERGKFLGRLPQRERPTRRSLLFHAKNQLGVTSAKYLIASDEYRTRNMRAQTDDPFKGVFGAGAVYCIDATRANIYCSHDSNGHIGVGRPVLYLVVDIYTRSIVGFHCSLGNPCWIEAMAALHSCLMDKTKLAKFWGLSIAPEDWMQKGLCQKLVGDRGELTAIFPPGLIRRQALDFVLCPPYRPDLKGCVESAIHFTPEIIRPGTPGWVNGIHERGQEFPALSKAKITLAQFAQKMIRAIIAYNASVREDYPFVKAQMDEGVPSVPNKLWAWSEGVFGRVRQPDPLEAFIDMCPVVKGKTTVHGLEVLGHHYTCDRAVAEQWFENASVKRESYDVSVDLRTNLTVMVRDPRTGEPFGAELVEHERNEFGGLPFETAIAYMNERDRLNEMEIENKENARAKARFESQEITDAAHARSRVEGTDARSKAEQKRGLRLNKKQAHALFSPLQSPFSWKAHPQPDDPPDNVVKLRRPADEQQADMPPDESSNDAIARLLRGDNPV